VGVGGVCYMSQRRLLLWASTSATCGDVNVYEGRVCYMPRQQLLQWASVIATRVGLGSYKRQRTLLRRSASAAANGARTEVMPMRGRR
jgi:hypothetical protein